jgi:hypothetical protein
VLVWDGRGRGRAELDTAGRTGAWLGWVPFGAAAPPVGSDPGADVCPPPGWAGADTGPCRCPDLVGVAVAAAERRRPLLVATLDACAVPLALLVG